MSKTPEIPVKTDPAALGPFVETTGDIRVTVVPQYVEDGFDGNPAEGFVFSYTVTIENLGAEAVQLLSRHWMIYSGGELFNEVTGDGVVGVQPVIPPNEGFQYSSWAVIDDPAGSMRGSYELRMSSGTILSVTIPEFLLEAPHTIH